MPYAKRICTECRKDFVPRARYDDRCGPCRLATPNTTANMVPTGPAKVLFFDIETAGVNALKSDLAFVVCFGYKWNHEKKAQCIIARKRDLKHFDDRWLLQRASEILEGADIVVGHFASVFDRRFFQGRLLVNDLPPVPPTKMRDTCMIARSVANFSSNRLQHLSEILNLKEKKRHKRSGTDWPGWWFRVMQGDTVALSKMAQYCAQDVLATEALYYRLLGFDRAHPRIVADRTLCGACGGSVIYHGVTWANGNRYRRYACTRCNRWDRESVKL